MAQASITDKPCRRSARVAAKRAADEVAKAKPKQSAAKTKRSKAASCEHSTRIQKNTQTTRSTKSKKRTAIQYATERALQVEQRVQDEQQPNKSTSAGSDAGVPSHGKDSDADRQVENKQQPDDNQHADDIKPPEQTSSTLPYINADIPAILWQLDNPTQSFDLPDGLEKQDWERTVEVSADEAKWKLDTWIVGDDEPSQKAYEAFYDSWAKFQRQAGGSASLSEESAGSLKRKRPLLLESVQHASEKRLFKRPRQMKDTGDHLHGLSYLLDTARNRLSCTTDNPRSKLEELSTEGYEAFDRVWSNQISQLPHQAEDSSSPDPDEFLAQLLAAETADPPQQRTSANIIKFKSQKAKNKLYISEQDMMLADEVSVYHRGEKVEFDQGKARGDGNCFWRSVSAALAGRGEPEPDRTSPVFWRKLKQRAYDFYKHVMFDQGAETMAKLQRSHHYQTHAAEPKSDVHVEEMLRPDKAVYAEQAAWQVLVDSLEEEVELVAFRPSYTGSSTAESYERPVDGSLVMEGTRGCSGKDVRQVFVAIYLSNERVPHYTPLFPKEHAFHFTEHLANKRAWSSRMDLLSDQVGLPDQQRLPARFMRPGAGQGSAAWATTALKASWSFEEATARGI